MMVCLTIFGLTVSPKGFHVLRRRFISRRVKSNPIFGREVGLKSFLSTWKSANADSSRSDQPAGLSCSEAEIYLPPSPVRRVAFNEGSVLRPSSGGLPARRVVPGKSFLSTWKSANADSSRSDQPAGLSCTEAEIYLPPSPVRRGAFYEGSDSRPPSGGLHLPGGLCQGSPSSVRGSPLTRTRRAAASPQAAN